MVLHCNVYPNNFLSVCFQVLRSTTALRKELYETLGGRCPQVMSLESEYVGAEDKKNQGVWSRKEGSLPDLCSLVTLA